VGEALTELKLLTEDGWVLALADRIVDVTFTLHEAPDRAAVVRMLAGRWRPDRSRRARTAAGSGRPPPRQRAVPAGRRRD
jgi:hypothetical protein